MQTNKVVQYNKNIMKKLTKEEFLKKAKEIQYNKYDYSKVEYVNNATKVCIICPEHGEFYQRPANHLSGQGCPLCKGTFKSNNKKFIKESTEIHKGKYDYSKIEYISSRTKVCIICPEHGEFWQTPYHHLKGHGCPKCRNKDNGDRYRYNSEEFIRLSKLVHCKKYKYDKVKYVNSHSKVCIICPEHGEFFQTAYVHLQGHECPECAKIKRSQSNTNDTAEFIKRSILVHSNKYDYSKAKYINSHSKVCIICPKHGEFWQLPCCHVNLKNGCPYCNESQSEMEIENILTQKNILHIRQMKFDWLGKQSLDFYLPDYNVAIECQGKQHFEIVNYFGGEKGFESLKERDLRKKSLCEENGITILYYANYIYHFPYDVYTNKELLINEILTKYNKK